MGGEVVEERVGEAGLGKELEPARPVSVLARLGGGGAAALCSQVCSSEASFEVRALGRGETLKEAGTCDG